MATFGVLGKTRRLSVDAYTGTSDQAHMNNRGDLCFAQALPHKAELTRLANTWSCQIATGSAFTNVANMPTTRAELAIRNSYSNNTCLVIDSVWGFCLTSITAASGFTLIYQVSPDAAALTNDTAQLINSPLGTVYAGSVTRALAVTTMTANKWAVLASSNGGAAVSIGCGIQAEVNGGIIVKSGGTLGLNWIVGTATGTTCIGVSWHEVVLDRN